MSNVTFSVTIELPDSNDSDALVKEVGEEILNLVREYRPTDIQAIVRIDGTTPLARTVQR